jgi:transcriptional regulator with XRE-family HTH domain
MSEVSETRRRLGQELQRLRDLAGLSGREMGRRTGVSQPTMTRIDRGLALPRMPVVRQWLDECDADDNTRVRLIELAEAAHGETKRWAELLTSDQHLQDKVRDADAAATYVRNFQPTVLPGLLQTAAYARAVLELGRTDVAAAVAGRLTRQELLHEPGRRFDFLIAERLIRWAPAPASSAGQRDRLLTLATLDAVDLAVLPDGAAPGLLCWHNFVIRQGRSGTAWVATELFHGAQEIRDPVSVGIYEQVWTSLWDAAAHGDDATRMIREAGSG